MLASTYINCASYILRHINYSNGMVSTCDSLSRDPGEASTMIFVVYSFIHEFYGFSSNLIKTINLQALLLCAKYSWSSCHIFKCPHFYSSLIGHATPLIYIANCYEVMTPAHAGCINYQHCI